jgi:predicted NAD/FAD-dependent oxidoreductase
MQNGTAQSVAVIGTGIAVAACAHALMLAGHSVQTFDKSRGPGGRLATRRVEWVDRQRVACTTPFDHGAVGITASDAAFQTFIDDAVRAGWLAEWTPARAGGSRLPDDSARVHVPAPDMPALCRHLLDGVADWAAQAAEAPMQSCWTLFGIADAPEAALGWDLARPTSGSLAWVMCNEARPGRKRVAGQVHWVVHGQADWSRQHLEQPAAWVCQQLQAALAEHLGRPVDWHHAVVHRWRYALPQAPGLALLGSCWWDAAQRLGVCGDFLGGLGVEGAWLSAQSLSAALLQCLSDPAHMHKQAVAGPVLE